MLGEAQIDANLPDEVRPLIEAILDRMHPRAIWLFGSRARGDNRPDSDWDLLVTLPDDADEALLSPMAGWRIKNELGFDATVLTTTESDFAEAWGSINTLGYEVARDGRRLYG